MPEELETPLVPPASQNVSLGVVPVPGLSAATHTTLAFVFRVWVNHLAVSPVAQLLSLKTVGALSQVDAGSLRLCS